MDQLALHLPPPAARRRDPETSKAAARSMRQAATEQAAKVLNALRDLGEAGAEQIGDRCGLNAYAVRKRLPELEAAGHVEVVMDGDKPKTRTTGSGRSERVWRVAA
jgi:predicted ArsR family transcriptional regulator